MTNAIQTNALAEIKNYLQNDIVKARFAEMLGKRSGAFINSIINVTRINDRLLLCPPESVIGAATIAASLNLPIDPALGQAAIVPYGKVAQFQIMYKGVTQLCIRSGQYKTIHCTVVYKDEIESWNPITSEVAFTDQSTWKLREGGKFDDVAGHYAQFKLLAGFEKVDYMPTQEAMAHGAKYSKSYQADLAKGWTSSKWSTDPLPMCNKTVLLRLLTKYGVMSIEMQEAFIADHEDFGEAQTRSDEFIKNDAGSEVIDAEVIEPTKTQEPASVKVPDWVTK